MDGKLMGIERTVQVSGLSGNLQDGGILFVCGEAQKRSLAADLTELVDMGSPQDVYREIKVIVLDMLPDFDFRALDRAFGDVLKLYRGEYPGFRACNTRYHDLKHTTDAFLAMARLIHGAFRDGVRFTKRLVNLGLISALMHDTGYIQSVDDRSGTGGKYTLVHVRRSIEFMDDYLSQKAFSGEDSALCGKFLRCTGLETRIYEIGFDSPEEETIGKMLGTADILGQLADASYLSKLPWLYREFQEADVPGYRDELDLLDKTPLFYEFTLKRAEAELGGVHRYLRKHFLARWQMDRNLYLDAAERNIACLRRVLDTCYEAYSDRDVRSRLVLSTIAGALPAGGAPHPIASHDGFSVQPLPTMKSFA